MLKLKLGAFGWHEAVRRERKATRTAAVGVDAAADLQDYLERMGVRCETHDESVWRTNYVQMRNLAVKRWLQYDETNRVPLHLSTVMLLSVKGWRPRSQWPI